MATLRWLCTRCRRTPGSSSPATPVWSAPPSCAASDRPGYDNLLLVRRSELDLRDQAAVNDWFDEQPARSTCSSSPARSAASWPTRTRPAEFLYDNMMIHATVVHAAHLVGVDKLLYLGSSCIYPRLAHAADQRGRAAHRSARTHQRALRDRQDRRHQAVPGLRAASTAATSSRRCRPTSTGPTTTSTSTSSHVLPAMIRKFHDARVSGAESVVIWGTGSRSPRVPPRRRPRRRVRVPHGPLRRRRAHQRRHR